MKKIYLVTIAHLTSTLWCQYSLPPLFEQRELPPSTLAQHLAPATSGQREFAKEALALRYSAGPILGPKLGLISYSTERGDYKFTFAGYLKTDFWWDSWQVRGSAQDHFNFFPEEPIYDRCGRDILRKGRFNILAIESQVRVEIEGPRVFGARSYGVIEPDFRGGDLIALVNIMRMVLGYIYLDWTDKSLLIGQYFHPIFPAEYKCYAQTISYNFGLPFDPYALEPQIRFAKQYGMMTYQLTFLSHTYRFYGGPSGVFTMLYARNAVMPNINFLSVASIGKHRVGFSLDMIRIIPRLRTNLDLPPEQSLRSVESLVSFMGLFFVVLDFENILLKFKTIWAQNAAGYAFISGYGVQCVDPLTDVRTYINTQQVNAWTDVTFKKFMPFEPGFFFGFCKNLGANSRLIPFINGVESVYTPGNRHHMASLLRFSPRLRWYAQPFVLGTELEFTRVYWGKINDYARVVNASPRNNLRLLFGAYYYF